MSISIAEKDQEMNNFNDSQNQPIASTPGSQSSQAGLLPSPSGLTATVRSINRKTNVILCISILVGAAAIIVCIVAGYGMGEAKNIRDTNKRLDDYLAKREQEIPGLAAGSPSTWKKISPTGQAIPHSRLAHAATGIGGVMYIHGGLYGRLPPTQQFNDLWKYTENLDEWVQLTTTGDVPAKRLHHSLVSTPDGKTLLLFGGFNKFQTETHTPFDDLYKLDLDTLVWTRLDTNLVTKPTARGAHDCVWLGDMTGGMYCFGGFPQIAATGQMNELWKYSLASNTWTNLTHAVQYDWDWPDPRIGFSFSEISDTKAHLFGGGCSVANDPLLNDDDGAGQCGSDSWIYDSKTDTFSRLNLTAGSAAPGPRRATHGDVSIEGMIFLYGGVFINGTFETRMLDDLWVLQLDAAQGGPRWMQLFPNYNMGTRPPKLFGHSVVRLGRKAVVFGGRAGVPTNDGTNDIWEYTIVPPL